MVSDESDELSQTFAALSDPTRRRILGILADGEKTVTELVEPFDLTQPAISKHLQVLEQAGLVERRREAQRRPATLRVAALIEAAQWLGRCFEAHEVVDDRPGEPAQSEHKLPGTGEQDAVDAKSTAKKPDTSDWQMF